MSTTIDPTSRPEIAVASPAHKLPKPHLATPHRRTRPSRLRGFALKLAIAALLLLLAAWGARHWFFNSMGKAAEITATVTRAMLPIAVTERGELESSKTVDVRCEVEGYQIKIVTIAPEGTRVTKDQVVVTFDTDQLKRQHDDQEVKWKTAEGKAKACKGELEVQKNKAATDIDKADLALILAELDVKKYVEGEYLVNLEKLMGEIDLAKKDVVETAENLEKYRKFVRHGFGTQETLRSKELELSSKQYQLKSKENDLKVLKDFTKIRQETELTAKARDAKRELDRAKSTGEAAVDKAKSELDAAEVQTRLEKQALDRLKKQLERCVVKAPQDGILVYSKDRYWDAAARVQPGAMVHYQQTLFSLPDLTQMQVKVKIHESMVKKISKGMKAEVRVEAYPDAVLHGTIENVATLANSMGYWDERGVKEYVTIVKIEDLPTEAGLKPGMTGEVKILAKELPDVLIVPVQAVGQKETQHFSYVAGAKGVEKREVTVGENNDKFVEIKEGLEEGEKVVLDARARLAAETKASESIPQEQQKTKAPEPAARPVAAAPGTP